MRQLESILIGFFKKCVYFHKKMQKKIPKLYLLCVKLVNRVLQNVYLPSILSSKKGVDNKLIKLISNIFLI